VLPVIEPILQRAIHGPAGTADRQGDEDEEAQRTQPHRAPALGYVRKARGSGAMSALLWRSRVTLAWRRV